MNRTKERERRHLLDNIAHWITILGIFCSSSISWDDRILGIFLFFLLFFLFFFSFSITKKKRVIHTPTLLQNKKKKNESKTRKKKSYTCRQMLQTLFNRSSSYLWDPKLHSISFVLSLYVFLQAKLISFAWQGKFLIQSIWCWIPFSVATSNVSKWISSWYLPTALAM